MTFIVLQIVQLFISYSLWYWRQSWLPYTHGSPVSAQSAVVTLNMQAPQQTTIFVSIYERSIMDINNPGGYPKSMHKKWQIHKISCKNCEGLIFCDNQHTVHVIWGPDSLDQKPKNREYPYFQISLSLSLPMSIGAYNSEHYRAWDIIIIILRAFIQRKFARATNALCRQRWQYGYVTVYVSIAIYITNCQDS